MLGFYGAEDAIIPLADVRELEERLAKSGRPGEVRVYPGAGHAFLNDTRPELYRPAAAADAWPRLRRVPPRARFRNGDGLNQSRNPRGRF